VRAAPPARAPLLGGCTPLHSLLSRYVRDPNATWTCGGFGALAEFHFDRGEPIDFIDGLTIGAATDRGAFRLECVPQLRPVAYETLGKNAKRWGQGLVLCLPRKAALMGKRRVVTELGPDGEAIRPQDRQAILFDLGIGKPQSDICVRSADPPTIALLRAACGSVLFEHGNPLAEQMPSLSPHRVFRSKVGRVEVYQAIPPPNGKTPDGPHTHVRPRLVAHRRSHAATVPVPDGWLPVLWLFPPHPLQNASGHAIRFDSTRFDAFQALIDCFGDPEMIVGKIAACRAAEEADKSAEIEAALTTRAARLGFRIAQRQLLYTRKCGASPKI
jgi:hypothetical protein